MKKERLEAITAWVLDSNVSFSERTHAVLLELIESVVPTNVEPTGLHKHRSPHWEGFKSGDQCILVWEDAPEQRGKVMGFTDRTHRIIMVSTDDGMWTRSIQYGGVLRVAAARDPEELRKRDGGFDPC